jgi:hypothetical protein
MQKTLKVQDKYYLKALHQEIDFFDRKLAYMKEYESFPSIEERDKAIDKVTKKRASLAREAQQLVKNGIEFQPSELPRSFRTEQAESSESL